MIGASTLAGRVRLRIHPVPGAPVVALRAWLPGGCRTESISGQGRVTGRLLSEGTRRRDFQRIAADAEAVGADISSSGGFERVWVAIDALADDWQRACDWLAELVLESSFPPERARWVIRQVGAELESLGDRPEIRTAWAFMEQLYAPHPFARPVQGTPDGLASLTAEDCAAFHAASLAAGPIITAAGSLPEAGLEEHLEGLFGHLETGATESSPPAPPPDRGPARRQVSLPDSDQAYLFAGHLTVPRAHPDYEALELLGVVLGAGAGLTGRIPERIREREGLAYTARGQMVAGAGLEPGRLVVYLGTSADRVEQAEHGVREELERLVAEGIGDDELESCRSYLLGREPFERETARQWAELSAEAVLYGLPLDEPGWREERLRALTRSEVEAAARRHLRPDRLQVTVGLPA